MADAVGLYCQIVWMWIRSSVVYRASFLMLTFSQFVVTGLDFVVIWIMFAHTDLLGGFDLAEVAFLYAGSGVALGIADLLIGSIDRIGTRIRDGSFDVILIRPVSAFVQAAADQFALRRLGRILQSSVVFVWSLVALDIDWGWSQIALVPVMVLSGSVIFCAIFVLGASFQFVAGEAADVVNAFTYGGNFLTQYPPTIFGRDLLRGATFIVPLAFVNWMPALYILGHDDPLGLPAFADFASPVVAVLFSLVAAVAWRAAVRSYRSAGS